MRNRFYALIAAIVAMVMSPLAAFAAANPVLFAAVITDVGLIQYGVGAGVSALMGWIFKNKTPANNRFIIPVNSLATSLLYYGLGAAGVIPAQPFDVCFGSGAGTAVTTGALHGLAVGIPEQRNPLKETPEDRAKRLSK